MMPEEMECRVCGSLISSHDVVFTAREMMFGLRDEFRVTECRECSSLNLGEVPDDMSRYYPFDEYYSFDESPLAKLEELGPRLAVKTLWQLVRLRQTQRLRRLLQKLPDRRLIGAVDMLEAIAVAGAPLKKCRLLDVGSGIGISTLMLGQLGANALGIDPFGVAWKRNGAEQRVCTIEDVQGEWDVILFQHSLEHVENPLAAMHRAKGLLAPDGRVIVRIPAADSHARRVYGANWVNLDAPRHYFAPSREGMKALGNRAGLRLERCYDDARDMQFWGSEQYVRGIPLYDERSAVRPGQGVFPPSQMKSWTKETLRLNRIGEGDLITAIYRKDQE
jgi:SAM-dependent methyltransferase